MDQSQELRMDVKKVELKTEPPPGKPAHFDAKVLQHEHIFATFWRGTAYERKPFAVQYFAFRDEVIHQRTSRAILRAMATGKIPAELSLVILGHLASKQPAVSIIQLDDITYAREQALGVCQSAIKLQGMFQEALINSGLIRLGTKSGDTEPADIAKIVARLPHAIQNLELECYIQPNCNTVRYLQEANRTTQMLNAVPTTFPKLQTLSLHVTLGEICHPHLDPAKWNVIACRASFNSILPYSRVMADLLTALTSGSTDTEVSLRVTMKDWSASTVHSKTMRVFAGNNWGQIMKIVSS